MSKGLKKKYYKMCSPHQASFLSLIKHDNYSTGEWPKVTFDKNWGQIPFLTNQFNTLFYYT